MLNKTVKRIIIHLLLFFPAVLLSGCGSIREKAADLLWNHSGIPEDAEYQQYLELDASGSLDEDGLYRSEVIEQQRLEEASQPDGAVHVSFARNDHLLIDYYLDEAMTIPLKADSWRLDPGEAVYASMPVPANPNSSLYRFSEFRIREFDNRGNVRDLASVKPDLPGEVYRIPEDFTGTEISIAPLGEYQKRIVTLSAGYTREDGQWTELENGAWEINGTRYGSGMAELDPMGVYRVVYDYSAYKDQWYFVGSSPECYWDKDSDGTITFFAVPSNEERVDYKVTLHRYGSMVIRNGVSYQNPVDSLLDSASALFGNRSIIETQNIIDLLQVNGISVINNFSDTEIDIPGLKAGDEVTIRVPAELKVIGSGLAVPRPESKNGGREYRLTIPNADEMNFSLSVGVRNSASDTPFRSFTVSSGAARIYDASGIEYTEGAELPAENEKVTLEITPDEGYCIYGKNIRDNIYRAEMKYADLLSKYTEILSSHPIRPGIMVTLDTEDELGDCVFWSGNTALSGPVMLREGQDLQFDYMLKQNSGFELILTKEDAAEAVNVWSPYAATRELDVTENMNGKTLRCRDYLTMKEVSATDAVADPF